MKIKETETATYFTFELLGVIYTYIVHKVENLFNLTESNEQNSKLER